MKLNEIPLLSYFLLLVGIVLIVFSINHFNSYPDPSQEIIFIVLGFGIIFVGYDYWWKEKKEKQYEELVKMCDCFLNWKTKVELKDK